MKRVMIIGQPGSGKSTLAAQMGEVTGLPVFHIDREVLWLPHWQERPREEKNALCYAIHAQDEWIFEGGNSTTWPDRLHRADTLIWLDFPLTVRLWRVVKRTIKTFGKSRPDMADDCPEQFDPEFFKWIWNTRKTGRANSKQLFNSAPPTKSKYRLTNRNSVQQYINTLTAAYRG